MGKELCFKVGMCVCLLASFTGGFTSPRLEQFQCFYFPFARKLIRTILIVALLREFYKLMGVFLFHT